MSNRTPSYSYVFVCQAGELEVKALLLAASLRRFLDGSFELVAAIPEPENVWGTPAPRTLRLLHDMGVRTVPVRNEVDPAFTHANKIGCLNVKVDTDWLVFIDSDILCIRAFKDEPPLTGPFSAKPADLQNFARDRGDWEEAYGTAGADLPALQIPATVSKEYGLPYFNSGFLVVQPGARLGDTWLDCCQRIRANTTISDRRLSSDQASLAVAVHKLGLPVYCLDERFNYPAHLRPLMGRSAPIFVHYHFPDVVVREPALRENVRDSIGQYPAILDVMQSQPTWTELCDHVAPSRPDSRGRRQSTCASRPDPALIITGISRSGTSYLCNLLHRYSNCVVLNEPAEVFPPLLNEIVPWSIPILFQHVRTNILSGKPIFNKLRDGEVTEDTAVHEEQQAYTPDVDDEQFVLGMKNNMAFLSRIPELRRVMPEARFVICVRNPLDTIDSWKRSFEHLRLADVGSRPVGHPDDAWWSGHQAASLRRIVDVENLSQRRAMLWQFLAERILDQLGDAVLVNYAELVSRPDVVLDRILDGFQRGALRQPILPTQMSRERSALDDEDFRAIQAICSQSAAELGVNDVR